MEEWHSNEEWTLTGLDSGEGALAMGAWDPGHWGPNMDTAKGVWPNEAYGMAPHMGLMAAGMTTWAAEAYAPPGAAASYVRPVDKQDPAMSSPWNLPVPLDDATLPSFTLPDPADEMPEKEEIDDHAFSNGLQQHVPDSMMSLAQGIFASETIVDGSPCTRVEWQIDDFCSKLQATMNRHLVSPGFNICGLNNLRLMLSANTREILKGSNARGSRGRKGGALATMSKMGPLHGSLKLKAEGADEMKFNLTVGKERQGPLVNNFSSQVVHGVEDFGVDWLKEVDKSTGSLTVGIEFIVVRSK
mmetsp:Transcript_56482/g.104587  ORF Transcript_56482/g.104587 Transcript_56482/m.104587 type:complete len:301 (+) Transcript_56482:126-1028(+)